MLRAGSSLGGRRSAPVLVWLLPTVVTVAAAVVAVSLTSTGARAGVVWCGVVGTAAVGIVAAEAARRGRALAALREQHARQESELRYRLARQQTETVRLAEVTLPETVARLQRGEFTEDVLKAYESYDGVVGPEFQAARHAVLRTVLEAVDNEEGLRESAQRAFVNIARRVQAIVHRQAQDLREMEDRHGNDPAVFDDLLRLDHGNALVGRLADSIAVLGGARPGRQWSRAVPLYSVLRGGISRILDYQRVELHPVSEVAVVGPAAEPLIHALAELLDNATRYSPPHTNVHLTAVEVQTGIAIEIEDGGLSLSEEGRGRAERMLRDAQEGIDLNDLGETPRLGLAVVGRLAQEYGFQVSLRPSAYGGVRAVLIVPQELITTAPAVGRAHGIGIAAGSRPGSAAALRSAGGPRPWGAKTVPGVIAESPHRSSAAGGPAAVGEQTPDGLPQRRRHAASSWTGAPEGAGVPRPTPAPVQPGMWLAAFHEGVNGNAPSSGGADHTSEESAGKGEE
ncbi:MULTISPECIES: ATP-binding protein [unclassified Kitasatospora]|uniref:ATP-binding protein n=1 Tax=unclassified Kitasatospora TaxID=2633591 RepID=UPI0007C676B5|nr:MULTISPECIES: ATP-binding protein [unclassified Kitasatospora]